MQSEHFHQELTPVSEALRAAEVSLPWSASRITGRIIPIFLLHLHLLLPLDTAACFALPCSTTQWVLSQLWLLFQWFHACCSSECRKFDGPHYKDITLLQKSPLLLEHFRQVLWLSLCVLQGVNAGYPLPAQQVEHMDRHHWVGSDFLGLHRPGRVVGIHESSP